MSVMAKTLVKNNNFFKKLSKAKRSQAITQLYNISELHTENSQKLEREIIA